MKDSGFEKLLELAIGEDCDDLGDVTSLAIFGDESCHAGLYSKDEGILAGSSYFKRVFDRIDPSVKVSFLQEEGAHLSPGVLIADITGPTISVLTAERIALNFLGYLSGIATISRRFADLQQGHTRILDTRKTLPGYRALAKYAVSVGGATNHRMGLYDMVMIKDNHIDAAGSITAAVEHVRRRWKKRFRIEVECRSIGEVSEALAAGADIIMLDNMSPADSAEALLLRRDGVEFEASGDMSLERVGPYMEIGLDYISVGRLTHSVRNFDFSLRMETQSS